MKILEKSINRNIPVPLYYQLKELLKEHINISSTGEAIPTEIEFCKHFGISRPTVRQAISELVSEGFLQRSKGKGTFINSPKIKRDFFLVLESFNKEMIGKGFKPGTKLIKMDKTFPNESICEKLSITPSDEIIFFRRLRFTDGIPFFVVDSYLPAAKLPGIEKYDLDKCSLHSLLQNEFSFKFGSATRSIEAVPAEHIEAELLGVKPESPLQYLETVIYLTDGSPIKYARTWYRGDRSRFTYELIKDQYKT